MSNADIIDFCHKFANAMPHTEAEPILNWLKASVWLEEVREAWTWASEEGASRVSSEGWETLCILVDQAMDINGMAVTDARRACHA